LLKYAYGDLKMSKEINTSDDDRSVLRPDVAQMVEMANLMEPASNLSLDNIRALVRQSCIQADLPRGKLAKVEDVVIAGGAGQDMRVRIYSADSQAAPAPVVLFMHGGGFMLCDLDTHDGLCAELARLTNLTIVSVDYRLAPEHGFPAAPEDCLAAAQWLSQSPCTINHPVTGLIVAGDSAGGTLAAVCAQYSNSLRCPILVQWLLYAGTDMQASGGSIDAFESGLILTKAMMDQYRDVYLQGDVDRSIPQVSPLNWADFSTLPPAAIFACEYDPLRDQSREFASKLIRHGVSVRYREGKGLTHGSLLQRAVLPSVEEDLRGCATDMLSLLSEISRFRHLDHPPAAPKSS
jgi:acetyl esterase